MPKLLKLFLAAYIVVLPSVICAEEHRATVTASAYNSLPAQTDATPFEAAWGDELKPGMKIIAVSGDLIELGLDRGTKVRIDAFPSNTWTVLDRMPSRHRNQIDIYMGLDLKAAREWGIKEVTIHWEE